jgi:hypothetical protein
MAKPKTPLSTRIRAYQETHPNASAKDIAAKFKTTAGYIYAIRNKDKSDGGWKTVSLSMSDKPILGRTNTITMAQDDITNLTDEQKERLAYNLGRPRMRMQSSAPLFGRKRFEEESVIQEDDTAEPVDNVNHPPHYKAGGIETIDFIEAKQLSYHLGNVVKYIARADYKGNRKEDLLKAQWYLNREIAKL